MADVYEVSLACRPQYSRDEAKCRFITVQQSMKSRSRSVTDDGNGQGGSWWMFMKFY